MEEFILVYQNELQTVLSHNIFFRLNEKPKLSFNFDILDCETPTEVFFYILDDKQIILTEEQIEEVRKYCEDFYKNGNYIVYTYDTTDNNIFKGAMLVSEAKEKGYSYVLDNIPSKVASYFDETLNKWIDYYAVIMEDGTMLVDTNIPSTNKCVIFLTKEEYEKFPKKTRYTDQWDFVTERWIDKRNIYAYKQESINNLHKIFEEKRIMDANERVEAYEQDTWRIQLSEAIGFLQEKHYPTPYIDTYLETKGVDMEEKYNFAKKIKEKNDRYIISMARVNAIQDKYKERIEKASTCYEVDDINGEIELYKKERF